MPATYERMPDDQYLCYSVRCILDAVHAGKGVTFELHQAHTLRKQITIRPDAINIYDADGVWVAKPDDYVACDNKGTFTHMAFGDGFVHPNHDGHHCGFYIDLLPKDDD